MVIALHQTTTLARRDHGCADTTISTSRVIALRCLLSWRQRSFATAGFSEVSACAVKENKASPKEVNVCEG